MSITTITINDVDYHSYATVAEADAYLAIDVARSEAWGKLDEEARGQRLAAATRRLDGLRWTGRKASDTQIAAWPRLDMTPEPSAPIPPGIEQATMLLAGNHNMGRMDDGEDQPVQSVRVGPIATSYFYPGRRSHMAQLLGGALPLLSQWLVSPGIAAPVATGTDAESAFVPRDRYGRSEGIG